MYYRHVVFDEEDILKASMETKQASKLSVVVSLLEANESPDYLNLKDKKKIKEMLAQIAEEEDEKVESIVFSCSVQKINHRGKIQDRILMITDGAVYNITTNFK